ncbi:MAG TPA: hypothetical protein PKI66_08210 [Methanobacteriaceae archaeon]|nr:hypothetical protein [Methanobacteriaceae archaeon]
MNNDDILETEHQERIRDIHQKIDNIEYNIKRSFDLMILYLHLTNREDCSPEVRKAIDKLVKNYLEKYDLTIKKLIDRELSGIGGLGGKY